MRDTRPTPRPTLLLFTLGAERDCARRRLLPGRLRGAELGLRHAALEAAMAAGREAGLALAVSSPRPLAMAPAGDATHLPQRGSGFGARLADAFGAALGAAGGEPVVAVGGDSPGLTAAHLRAALDRLGDHPDRVVAGPSPDGGFYLIAARRPIPGLASGVRWCRRDALASLRRLLAAAGRELVLIAPLADLDRPADLHRWLARAAALAALPGRVLGSLLRLLAELARPPIPAAIGRPRPALVPVRAGRGPPTPHRSR